MAAIACSVLIIFQVSNYLLTSTKATISKVIIAAHKERVTNSLASC